MRVEVGPNENISTKKAPIHPLKPTRPFKILVAVTQVAVTIFKFVIDSENLSQIKKYCATKGENRYDLGLSAIRFILLGLGLGFLVIYYILYTALHIFIKFSKH